MNDEFSPLIFGDKRKEKIQKEAYINWEKNNYRGIVELVTGGGKSQIGLMALLKHRHLTKLFIVVPKIDLLNQWYVDVIDKCQVNPEFVGRVGGKFKEYNKPITIAVINSIRNKAISSELMILDEIQHYSSKSNSHFLLKGNHKRILGLTASMGENILKLPIVYTMSQEEAVNIGIISPYKIVNIGCDLTPSEQITYNKHNMVMKVNFPYFEYDLKSVFVAVKCSNDTEQRNMAMSVVRAIQHRKSLVGNAQNKLNTTIKLIKDNKNKKILVFCEYIKTSDYIIKQLKKDGIVAGKFHSKMKTCEKQDLFDKFKNSKITTMIAVKGLDEGTNIPDCDMAIIVSGSSVQRQIVQRIGRVVRISEGKSYATIYQVYCRGTKDEDWTKTRSNFVKKGAIGIEWI
ncbi:MAG: DEAD/DEAH box helicase [Spirochaetia bacterium]|nr:DEAD/DEAH box helicase [Spirochaetia bacterium]